MHEVRIDKRSCQSSGNCIDASPDAFSWDEDGLGDVRAAARELDEERLAAIARRCPARCITLHDADGAEIELD